MKKNRSTLKDYFKKGAIPTESNFADLIDSMLNQDEDNIAKLPNDPLKITAIGVDEALVNFYRMENNAEKLSWQIKQKPESKSGLSISDSASVRLFIENATGNVGIGTTTPKAKFQVLGAQDRVSLRVGQGDAAGNDLTVDISSGQGLANLVAGAKIKADGGGYTFLGTRGASRLSLHDGAINFYTSDLTGGTANADVAGLTSGSAKMVLTNTGSVGIGVGGNTPIAKLDILAETRTGTHPSAVKGLYVTGAFGDSSDGVEFRNTNGNQGIGFGNNTIYATGSNTNQDLGLKPRGSGKVNVAGPMQVTGTLQVTGAIIQLDGAQRIAFGDNDTTNNLKIQLWSGYGIGINGSTQFYAADGNHSWRDKSGTNERMLLTTAADGGLTVKGTGNSSFAGNLGVGTTTPAARLDVSKTAAGTLGGAVRISNPAGGSGTYAALEFTTYDVGSSAPTARIAVTDNGNYSADIDIQTKNSGANTNALASRMKISADGNVNVSGYLSTKQVYFSAYLDLNTRSGNIATLQMQVASQNVGGGYDTSTSTFTAPVKGIYLFTMTAYKAEKDKDKGGLDWFLLVNGNSVNAGGNSTSEPTERGLITLSDAGTSASRTLLVALNVGDKVTIKQDGGGRMDNFRSGLEGILLSAT